MDIYEQFVEDINDLEDQRKKYINLIIEDTSKPAEYYLAMIETVDLQLNIRLFQDVLGMKKIFIFLFDKFPKDTSFFHHNNTCSQTFNTILFISITSFYKNIFL